MPEHPVIAPSSSEEPLLKRLPATPPGRQAHLHHENQRAYSEATGIPLSEPVEIAANEPYPTGGAVDTERGFEAAHGRRRDGGVRPSAKRELTSYPFPDREQQCR